MNVWRTDIPPVGQVAWVWVGSYQVRATWDGDVWRTAAGVPLSDVTHWRV